jgi:Protein of unknown function (DUF2637)
VSAGADRWIRWTTIGCVALLALIAGTVSYLHMHVLVARHGQPGWVAALTPLSAAGMIVAASTTLLADSRSGRKGGALPWALLVAGSVASLAANVAVAEPTLIGRVIAAWPSFALTASFELLTRQVRRGAAATSAHILRPRQPQSAPGAAVHRPVPELRVVDPSRGIQGSRHASGELQRQAWHWALAHRNQDGTPPSGEAIARAHGRGERWGRLVKNSGLTGVFGSEHAAAPRLVGDDGKTMCVLSRDLVCMPPTATRAQSRAESCA